MAPPNSWPSHSSKTNGPLTAPGNQIQWLSRAPSLARERWDGMMGNYQRSPDQNSLISVE